MAQLVTIKYEPFNCTICNSMGPFYPMSSTTFEFDPLYRSPRSNFEPGTARNECMISRVVAGFEYQICEK